jgi:hypothetical protein
VKSISNKEICDCEVSTCHSCSGISDSNTVIMLPKKPMAADFVYP